MPDPITILLAIITLLAGLMIGWSIAKSRSRKVLDEGLAEERARIEAERERLNAEADKRLQESLARERTLLDEQMKAERSLLENERGLLVRQQEQIQRLDAKLAKREDGLADRVQALDEKLTAIDRRETRMQAREEQIEARVAALDLRERDLGQAEARIEARLSELAGLSREQARAELLERVEAELEAEKDDLIRRRMGEVESTVKERATELIARAIQRYAAEHTADATTARVEIADEDMKGRIIGREGRNIRSFEQATGVDVIIDDTPGFITLSCFDGIRREIARRTLVELVADGRIHPARIEELLVKITQDMDQEVLRLGEDAAYACEVSGLHPKLQVLLGKLQFRTSYGQNVLKHSQEVAFLAGAMAADLGLDPKLGRRCGLLHDIGKALDHEQEGSHPLLGSEACARYGEPAAVVNAALAHHEGQEVTSLYTVLVAAADAISAARPGARRENVERYLKRLAQLEDIACSFTGVTKSYAIQAGRELRVIVNGHRLRDEQLANTARSIARRIEDEVAYPGEVKVTLIRETRQVAVAR